MDINLHNANLEIITTKSADFPKNNWPEIVFAGKSNVGKSSLINYLLNRKKLAYVGKTPGKTRTINFYNIDDKMYLVDLPGYGYAKGTKGEESRWAKYVQGYLMDRPQIKVIFHLVDSRHKPTKDDITMNEWLNTYGLPYVVVATKMDKLKASLKHKHLKLIKETLNMGDSEILTTSTLKKQGKEYILSIINEIL